MKIVLLGLVLGLALMISSCGSSAHKNAIVAGSDSTLAPVETKTANSDYKPAFPGQTRIAGVKTTAAFEGKVLSDKLKQPWGITNLPDGRFLITEKEGDMRIASQDGTLSDAITGALMNRHATAQIREGKRLLSVAAVRRPEQREERGVLRDREHLPVAQRPPPGGELEGEDPDLRHEGIGHAAAPRSGSGRSRTGR